MRPVLTGCFNEERRSVGRVRASLHTGGKVAELRTRRDRYWVPVRPPGLRPFRRKDQHLGCNCLTMVIFEQDRIGCLPTGLRPRLKCKREPWCFLPVTSRQANGKSMSMSLQLRPKFYSGRKHSCVIPTFKSLVEFVNLKIPRESPEKNTNRRENGAILFPYGEISVSVHYCNYTSLRSHHSDSYPTSVGVPGAIYTNVNDRQGDYAHRRVVNASDGRECQVSARSIHAQNSARKITISTRSRWWQSIAAEISVKSS